MGVVLLFVSRTDVLGRPGRFSARSRRSTPPKRGSRTARDQLPAEQSGHRADPMSFDDEARGRRWSERADRLRREQPAGRPTTRAGQVTGFTGQGDDVPVASPRPLDGSAFAAYLNERPLEGRTSLSDGKRPRPDHGDRRGAGPLPRDRPRRSCSGCLLPPMPAANHDRGAHRQRFDGGKQQTPREWNGEDCKYLDRLSRDSGGCTFPVVGVIGFRFGRRPRRTGSMMPTTSRRPNHSGTGCSGKLRGRDVKPLDQPGPGPRAPNRSPWAGIIMASADWVCSAPGFPPCTGVERPFRCPRSPTWTAELDPLRATAGGFSGSPGPSR